MVRTKLVLGNNKVINLQNAISSSMGSLRRGAVSLTATTAGANKCLSCSVSREKMFETENVLRCSATQDKFAWLCTSCLSATQQSH